MRTKQRGNRVFNEMIFILNDVCFDVIKIRRVKSSGCVFSVTGTSPLASFVLIISTGTRDGCLNTGCSTNVSLRFSCNQTITLKERSGNRCSPTQGCFNKCRVQNIWSEKEPNGTSLNLVTIKNNVKLAFLAKHC